MSIADKHPAPWSYTDGRFVDANGVRLTGPAPMRAILAAPDMLRVLREIGEQFGTDGSDILEEAGSLVFSIEKGQ